MDEQQESVSEDRDQDDPEAGVAGEEADDALEDVTTGRLIKGSPKEEVRQRIAQALGHEYRLSPPTWRATSRCRSRRTGRRRSRRVDIAIFAPGRPQELKDLRWVVMCRPEPKNGAKSVTKNRDHEQARDELDQLWRLMRAVPGCEYGLWPNGLDFVFLHKERTRFEDLAEPRVDWPPADGTRPYWTQTAGRVSSCVPRSIISSTAGVRPTWPNYEGRRRAYADQRPVRAPTSTGAGGQDEPDADGKDRRQRVLPRLHAVFRRRDQRHESECPRLGRGEDRHPSSHCSITVSHD